MADVSIAWLPVIVGVVIYQALGAFWYSPIGFGKLWMRGMGYTSAADMQADSEQAWMGYLVTALGAFIATTTLSALTDWTETYNAAGGATLGALMGLAFAGTVSAQSVMFESRKWSIFAINLGYNLVALAAIGALVSAWQTAPF